MKSVWRLLWLLALLACLAGVAACNNSDDDDDSGGDDDNNDDDNGDDDADDDDLIDDDTAGDDDATAGNACPFPAEDGLERIAGGIFQTTDKALAVGPDGALYVVAVQARAMCVYSSSDGETWTPDFIDRFAADAVLAVDAAGGLHVAYHDLEHDTLKYATQAKGEWTTTVVDDATAVGADPAIAVDADGAVHLSYYDETNARLKYATNATGAWQAEALTVADVQSYSALGIDSTGEVHIGCVTGEVSDRDVVVVSGQAGAWSVETAATLGTMAGDNVTLVVDANDHLHLAYGSRYLTNAAGDWQDSTYDDTDQANFAPALAVPASDDPRIGYLRVSTDPMGQGPPDIGYARLVEGEWDSEPVDPPEEFAAGLSLALDGSGQTRMTLSGNSLYGMAGGNKGWNSAKIANGEIAGDSAALAVSESGVRLVCYFATPGLAEEGDSVLRCAAPHGDGWSSETMDFVRWAGIINRRIAVAIAGDGDAHVFYANDDDGSLHHQYGVPGDWQSTEPPDRYDPSAVAATIDGSGLVHLAFGSGENSEVFHEVWDGSAWSSSRAVNGADSGVSLALDADGHAYIGYDNGIYPKGWYATDRGGDWELVQYSEYGESSSLAFTPDGNLAISHFSVNHGLWYGVYDGKSFDDEQIDTDDAAGFHNWLAFDADGFAHIVYYVWSNDFDLRYATNRSGSWQIYDLDTIGDVGEYATFAIDAEGVAHVAYLGENALWYRTFDTAGE